MMKGLTVLVQTVSSW